MATNPKGKLLTDSKNMQDLISSVSRDTALTEEQSAAAVSSALRYLTGRLPSPIVGQLHEFFQLNQDKPAYDRSTAAADQDTTESTHESE